MPTQRIDPKVIFASDAPAIDKPPVFSDKTKGWDVARTNDGRPEIKQMNKIQQDTDLKILWLNENAVLPYDASIDYPDGAVTLKDGSFKQLSSGSWVEFLDDFADKDAVKRGIANRYDSSLTYNLSERVILDNGDIVKSTVDGNVGDPNVDMIGWVKTNSASQIFDESGLSQQEWNNGVESIADLLAIPNPKNGSRVFVKSFYAGLGIGGQDFIKNNSTEKYNVGGFCVATDNTLTATQIGLTKSRSDNAVLLSSYLPQYKTIKLDDFYDVSSPIEMRIANTQVDGLRKDFGFNWVGGDGESTARNKRKVVCNLNSLSLANNTSTSEVYLNDFTVNLNSAKNVIGVDARYFTQQSKLHNLNIVEVGQGSIGIYVNKAWYSSIDDCTVSGWSESSGGVRQGIGVYLDTKLYPEDTPDEWNQINAFKTKVRCHTLDIGYMIDSSSGICGASIADYPTIENCNIGIKMTNGGTINNPDTFYVQAYLENNTIDVEWGDPSETVNRGGVVVWQNCFFSAIHSTINLWQGVHYFIGCSGLRNLTVGDGAECMLLGTPLPAGDMSAKVVALSMPSWNQTANTYAGVSLKPESGMSKRFLSGADNVTYDLSEFTQQLKKPYGGASFVVRVIVSDSEGVNIKSHSEIVCKLNASGDQYSFAVVSGSGLSVSTAGVLTVASSDYSTVDIMLSSM